MDKRVAENARNFIVSDRFTFKGTDIGPLFEVLAALNEEIRRGATSDEKDGTDKAPT